MADMIQSVTNAINQPTPQQNTAIGNADMGKYDFLQLLVTQLKNQDPLSPMQSQEFAAQLAQFSSLERLMSIDDNLKQGIDSDMLLAQTINNTLATTFIGKEVLSQGDNIALLSGQTAPLSFELADNAQKVTVKIYDENDNLVRTIEISELDRGRHTIEWDGNNENGNALAGGNYRFEVEALDGDENPVTVQTYSRGIVSAVKYENGQPVLIVNGKEVYFGDIVQIG